MPLVDLFPEFEFNSHDLLMEEANDVQGNKFHLANQMVQLQNIPVSDTDFQHCMCKIPSKLYSK